MSTITVIIPCCNYGRFLPEAVESVLAQTRLPEKILIGDDCSTDDSYDIALHYHNRNPSLIEVQRSPANLGVVGNLERVVRNADTDYVCILDADNRYKRDFLEESEKALDASPDAAVAYTDFVLFGPGAGNVYSSFPAEWQGFVLGNEWWCVTFPEFTPESSRYLLGTGNFVHGNSLYRRSAWESAGGYIIEPGIPEDYSLFRRMIMRGWSAVHVPRPLLEYRQHSSAQVNIVAHSTPVPPVQGGDSKRRLFAVVSCRAGIRKALFMLRSFLDVFHPTLHDSVYIIDNDRSLDIAAFKKRFPDTNVILNYEPLSVEENCRLLVQLSGGEGAGVYMTGEREELAAVAAEVMLEVEGFVCVRVGE